MYDSDGRYDYGWNTTRDDRGESSRNINRSKRRKKRSRVNMEKPCNICREIHEPRELSFDGIGINACGCIAHE